eukprot:scaffold183188_cov23-Tisochrysis_lutea.AAC.1
MESDKLKHAAGSTVAGIASSLVQSAERGMQHPLWRAFELLEARHVFIQGSTKSEAQQHQARQCCMHTLGRLCVLS